MTSGGEGEIGGMTSDEEQQAAVDACERFPSGQGPERPRVVPAELAATGTEESLDRSGTGVLGEELETRVLLVRGGPAAAVPGYSVEVAIGDAAHSDDAFGRLFGRVVGRA